MRGTKKGHRLQKERERVCPHLRELICNFSDIFRSEFVKISLCCLQNQGSRIRYRYREVVSTHTSITRKGSIASLELGCGSPTPPPHLGVSRSRDHTSHQNPLFSPSIWPISGTRKTLRPGEVRTGSHNTHHNLFPKSSLPLFLIFNPTHDNPRQPPTNFRLPSWCR